MADKDLRTFFLDTATNQKQKEHDVNDLQVRVYWRGVISRFV